MGQIMDACTKRNGEDGLLDACTRRETSDTTQQVRTIPIHLVQSSPNKSLWENWVNEEHPQAFGHLKLAHDGGFSEVKSLYTHSRWISSAMLIGFIAYNVYYVADLDSKLIFDQDKAAAALEVPISQIKDAFYISSALIAWAEGKLGLPIGIHPLIILGFLEYAWLILYVCLAVYFAVMMVVNKGFKRWYCVQALFWELMPTLSTYSAMKLLKEIVPSFFIANITEKMYNLQHAKSKRQWAVGFIFWLLWVVACFIIGFDTFLMKLRIVSIYASKDEAHKGFLEVVTDVLLPVLQFLLQCLGVVQLGPFIQKRLFTFIFGGEDGIMQPNEVEVMETWEALLAKRIWRENNCMKFVAVMTSFSSEDFQSLVLNEDAELKKATLGE